MCVPIPICKRKECYKNGLSVTPKHYTYILDTQSLLTCTIFSIVEQLGLHLPCVCAIWFTPSLHYSCLMPFAQMTAWQLALPFYSLSLPHLPLSLNLIVESCI